MAPPSHFLFALVCAVCALLPLRALDVEGPRHVASGASVVFRLQNATDLNDLAWSVSLKGITLHSGRQALRAGQASTLRFLAPELPGPHPLILDLSIGGVERSLWVLPEDPFALDRRRISETPLRVFDPEGTLSAHLKTLSLTAEAIHDPAVLRDGLLLVGALPPRVAAAFAEQLPALLDRGVPVLWFAGDALRVDATPLLRPHPKLTLGAAPHPLLADLPAAGLSLDTTRDRLMLLAQAEGSGWAALELRLGKGRLLLLPQSPEALRDSAAGATILHDLLLNLLNKTPSPVTP